MVKFMADPLLKSLLSPYSSKTALKSMGAFVSKEVHAVSDPLGWLHTYSTNRQAAALTCLPNFPKIKKSKLKDACCLIKAMLILISKCPEKCIKVQKGDYQCAVT